MSAGLDYSFARPPYPGWLREHGFSFVVRYLSWLPNSKVISKAEFDGLRAAGVDVVLNWEFDTSDFAGGWDNGVSCASEAMRQAQALGAWPCPIYFSKDTNTGASQADADFLNGAASVIGRERVGIYGSRGMVLWALGNGLARYGWQNVWGSPPWEPSAHLWQVTYNDDVGFGGVDRNQATQADFGQVGGQIATPPPPVASEDYTVRYARIVGSDAVTRYFILHNDGGLFYAYASTGDQNGKATGFYPYGNTYQLPGTWVAIVDAGYDGGDPGHPFMIGEGTNHGLYKIEWSGSAWDLVEL